MDEETHFQVPDQEINKLYIPSTGVASRHSENSPTPRPRGSSRTSDPKAKRGAKSDAEKLQVVIPESLNAAGVEMPDSNEWSKADGLWK